MSPDELRALADALEPMSAAPRFDGLPVVEFCAWLRQCADAKPVAWMHNGLVSTNKERVEHDETMNRSCGFKPKPIIPLYAAPAAPQAEPKREPCIGNDPACPCQDGDPCHYRDTATTKAWPIPQAEPKREPLSDDDINKIAWKQNLWTDGMVEFSFLAFARAVERAHGIGGGGSDAE